MHLELRVIVIAVVDVMDGQAVDTGAPKALERIFVLTQDSVVRVS